MFFAYMTQASGICITLRICTLCLVQEFVKSLHRNAVAVCRNSEKTVQSGICVIHFTINSPGQGLSVRSLKRDVGHAHSVFMHGFQFLCWRAVFCHSCRGDRKALVNKFVQQVFLAFDFCVIHWLDGQWLLFFFYSSCLVVASLNWCSLAPVTVCFMAYLHLRLLFLDKNAEKVTAQVQLEFRV